MKLAHLEVCNAVLLTGTVTGAARLLHMSQPAVTKMLQSAENQFGFKLFTREKNRLVPTQEALDLHPEILQIAGVRRVRGSPRHPGPFEIQCDLERPEHLSFDPGASRRHVRRPDHGSVHSRVRRLVSLVPSLHWWWPEPPFSAGWSSLPCGRLTTALLNASLAMGANTRQIVFGALLFEALPGILAAATVTAIALVSYTALAGVVGGGGVGDLAIRYGYQRFQPDVMFITVILLLLIVQVLQSAGQRLVLHFSR